MMIVYSIEFVGKGEKFRKFSYTFCRAGNKVAWTRSKLRISGLFFLFLSLSHSQLINFLKWKYHYFSEKIVIFQSFQPIPLFGKKSCLWWLFHDDLRAREWDREEKGTTNSAPKYSQSIVYCSPCTTSI